MRQKWESAIFHRDTISRDHFLVHYFNSIMVEANREYSYFLQKSVTR